MLGETAVKQSISHNLGSEILSLSSRLPSAQPAAPLVRFGFGAPKGYVGGCQPVQTCDRRHEK